MFQRLVQGFFLVFFFQSVLAQAANPYEDTRIKVLPPKAVATSNSEKGLIAEQKPADGKSGVNASRNATFPTFKFNEPKKESSSISFQIAILLFALVFGIDGWFRSQKELAFRDFQKNTESSVQDLAVYSEPRVLVRAMVLRILEVAGGPGKRPCLRSCGNFTRPGTWKPLFIDYPSIARIGEWFRKMLLING